MYSVLRTSAVAGVIGQLLGLRQQRGRFTVLANREGSYRVR
jgi:hypothetical protein